MPYRDYTHLDFDFPEPGILRIQFNNPKSLNSVSAEQHTELARIWGDIDRDPDVKVVIVTGAGDHGVLIWPLLCGMAKAKYHLMTCEPVSGEDAERMGLVSLCVPEEELQDRALAVARKLASLSQSAVRWTKYALNGWLRTAGPIFDVSVAYETLGFGGPDVREGVASLREKRRPQFSGPAD
jgi:enoyl-CoA hydratase